MLILLCVLQRAEIALENRKELERQITERKAKAAAVKDAEVELKSVFKAKAQAAERELEEQRAAEAQRKLAYRSVLDRQRECVSRRCYRGRRCGLTCAMRRPLVRACYCADVSFSKSGLGSLLCCVGCLICCSRCLRCVYCVSPPHTPLTACFPLCVNPLTRRLVRVCMRALCWLQLQGARRGA